jgi:hypothetical protein
MTVVEYRPSAAPGQWKQPDHLSDKPSFKSKRLGRVVSTAGVPHLPEEDVEDLYAELTQEIQTLGSRMASQRWPAEDFQRMKATKSRWGAVHQTLLTRLAAIKKAERRRDQLRRPFAEIFFDIAKQELPCDLFCRLREATFEQLGENSEELARMDAAAT